jgi:arginyl-tRNA--protein-N-Asp/Glu arginylyltransferase
MDLIFNKVGRAVSKGGYGGLPSDVFDVIFKEANPEGWRFDEEIYADKFVVIGRHDSGVRLRCMVSATYSADTVRLYFAFSESVDQSSKYYDTSYRWEKKTQLEEGQFLMSNAGRIKVWALDNSVNSDFCVAVWRRAKGFFYEVCLESLNYSVRIKQEKQNKNKKQDDLFS